MKNIFSILLPRKADNSIHGSKIPFYFLILIATIGIVRSCIHIFSPGGGAGSIAGMNLAVDGADEDQVLNGGRQRERKADDRVYEQARDEKPLAAVLVGHAADERLQDTAADGETCHHQADHDAAGAQAVGVDRQ